MKKAILRVAALLALALSGCGAPTAVAGAETPTPSTINGHYSATLAPLNASGVSGTVDMVVTDSTMDVTITLTGLVPNQPHQQHIHGAPNTTATCPTAASANADGIITLAAGTPAYGPVALPFEPIPTADVAGKISWSQRLRLFPEDDAAIAPLTRHVVLIHGMTYKGVYDQVLPAACGPIHAA